MDAERLAELFAELHALPPSSRQRDYLRGRIDEYVGQNAVSDDVVAQARAVAVARLSNQHLRSEASGGGRWRG